MIWLIIFVIGVAILIGCVIWSHGYGCGQRDEARRHLGELQEGIERQRRGLLR